MSGLTDDIDGVANTVSGSVRAFTTALGDKGDRVLADPAEKLVDAQLGAKEKVDGKKVKDVPGPVSAKTTTTLLNSNYEKYGFRLTAENAVVLGLIDAMGSSAQSLRDRASKLRN